MNLNLSQAQIGFIRGLGLAIIIAVLSFLGNAANLNGIVSEGLASVIAAIALAVEHKIEAGGGGSLFGAIRRS